ncbi:MAG TPA: hypothetical protein VNG13_10520 [Mycobacteriales bacterium]|nr:hypothetical protein [Mycobacteriales bacterium]
MEFAPPDEEEPALSPAPDQPPHVGRVIGTEDATPLVFHVALGEEQYLQLDEVVASRAALCRAVAP